MEMLVPLLAVVGFFSALIISIYMSYKTQHQQRMALIESGRTADIFSKKKIGQKENSFKYGLLFTGAGLGFLLGFLWSEIRNVDVAIVFPCTLIGGGLGLILFYIITRNVSDNSRD